MDPTTRANDLPKSEKKSEETSRTRSQWSVARFLTTLGYFGEIPFVGSFRWIQQLIGQSPTVPGISLSQYKQKVLLVVAGSCAPLSALAEHKRAVLNREGEAIACALQDRLADSAEVVFDGFAAEPLILSSLVKSADTVVVLWGDRSIEKDEKKDDNSREIAFARTAAVEVLSNFTERASERNATGAGPSVYVEQTVFDFAAKACDLSAWGALDDVVMGGVSKGSFFLRQPASASQASQAAVFAGLISTANSGGFSSVRTRNFEPPFDFEGWSGFRLRVQGDGQRYKFIARNSAGWDSPAYIHSFDTVAGELTVVDIPFEALVATFRAKSVQDAPAFDPQAVFSFQLMLSKFEYDRQLNPSFSPGAFELIVSEMSVYRPRRAVPLIVVSVTDEEKKNKQRSILTEVLSKSQVDYRLIELGEGSAEGDVAEAIAQALT